MTRISSLSGLIPFILMLVVCSAALAESSDSPPGSIDFIPLHEITPGMRGYGLTVFSGSQIDTFGVEVIGIQTKNKVAGSMLLVQVSGHDLELSKIAQGMSGSPVFLNGRFAGALAFGWSGSLAPIAGITPAAEILSLPTHLNSRSTDIRSVSLFPNELDALHSIVPPAVRCSTLPAELFTLPKSNPGLSGPPLNIEVLAELSLWPSSDELVFKLLGNIASASAVALPTSESWVCKPVGMVSGNAGSGITDGKSSTAGTLYPGSACAVPLVTGDAQLGVIGTVTWVEDKEVFMMGHPFMQRGPVDLPLAVADVLTILPSREMSFKMATIGEIVGSVYSDQRAGLGGRLGPAPEMIPVSVEVQIANGHGKPNGQGEFKTLEYQFFVVDDPIFTPTMVYWTLYNSLLAQGDDASTQTLSYELETVWDGPTEISAEPLLFEGVAAGPGGAASLASQWMAPISILLNNQYSPVSLKSVKARLKFTRPMALASIVSIAGPRTVVNQGQELAFQVELDPRYEDSEVLNLKFELPPELQPGNYRVVVASEAEFFALELQRAAGRFQVADLDGILDILRSGRSSGNLVLALFGPGSGTIIKGKEHAGVPRRVGRLLRQSNNQATPTLADYLLRQNLKTSWALLGHAVQNLKIVAPNRPIKEERRP